MVGGGPSVLYDAVAIVVSDEGARELAALAPAKDFVSDAHAHCKFVAHTPAAEELLSAAGVTDLDGGYVLLGRRGSAKRFVEACRSVRFWGRSTGESD
jgi:catalase